MRRSPDVVLLALLVFARLRIDTLAEALAVPLRVQDVNRHPFLGSLFSERAKEAFGPWVGDPVALVLGALGLGVLTLYLVVATYAGHQDEEKVYRLKQVLIWLAVLLLVVTPTLKMVLLRQESGPGSYSHDGGVIQTELVVDYFLQGRNPYSENYTNTPLVSWGIAEFRTAVYHYPYLPWTFVFSTPFALLSRALMGWYDQRFVYLFLFLLTLALVPGLTGGRNWRALALLMIVGLNPIMGVEIIFGANDVFVLAWVMLAFWLWRRGFPRSALFVYGLACASKPTAWLLAPFWAWVLVREEVHGWRDVPRLLPRMAVRAWPALLSFALLVLPYVLWDPWAFYDDVWRWAAGVGQTSYQIWGWGASNFVLALGWVGSRKDYWPFWMPELLVGVPLLAWLLTRQMRRNTLVAAAWHYGVFFLAVIYVSRFLNENYLGYILPVLAVGWLADEETGA